MTASNFVIYYHSREGSTAIINTLSGQNGIRVPVVEDLDRYRFSKNHKVGEIYQYLDEALSTGHLKNSDHQDSHLQSVDWNKPYQCIGFKWRIFGSPKKIAEIFNKHNVTVLVLTRRNFLELVCSTYIHKYANILQRKVKVPTFPQFRARNITGEKQEAYLDMMRRPRFAFFWPLFFKSTYARIIIKFRQYKMINKLKAEGVKITQIFYEDFDTNPEAFIRDFLDTIGMDSSVEINTRCDFIKVHDQPHASRINRIERGTTAPIGGWIFRRMNSYYDKLVDRI